MSVSKVLGVYLVILIVIFLLEIVLASTTTTTTEPTTKTTRTPKVRRKKTKRVRSTSTPKYQTKRRTTMRRRKPTTTVDPAEHKAKIDLESYLYKFQKFYCMKKTECTNDLLFFEREKEKVCARDTTTKKMVYFDHKCTMWEANCKQLGMFFHKDHKMCKDHGVHLYMNINDVNPAELVYFAVTSKFQG